MNVTHLTTAAQSDHTHSQYLTTAMASNNGSNFVQAGANFAGTNATGTIASNGISVSVAAPVAQTAFVFSNSNGVSWGTNGSTVTATVATNYQSQGNYLTTAMQSDASSAFAGTNGAITGGSITVNTAGVSVNLPAYLTTAMASNRGSDFVQANAGFAGTNASGTIASNGISISVAAPGAGGGAALKGSGTYTQNTGTIEFGNSNGITFGLSNNGTMTASHNGLTTAMASDAGSRFLNTGTTGATNASVTLQSNGLSVSVGNYITTGALSNHSHGVTLNLTNLSGTTGGNSNGITLSLSANAQTVQPVAVSGSNGSFNFSTLTFGNLNGLSFYTSNGSIVGSYTDGGGGGGAGTNTGLNLTNLTGTLSVNTNGVSLSMSAAAPGGGGGYSINQFENIPYVTMTNLSNMTATRFTQRPHFYPFELGGSLTHNFLMFEASRATSGSNAFTMQAALYTMANSTQLSLLASLQNVFSNTATASISGIRRFRLTGWETAGTALTPGQYVLMIMNSGTATASMNYSYRGGLTAVPPVGVILGGTDQVQTATSYLSNAAGWRNFWGNYTTTTASPPATVAKSHIQNWTSGNNLYFYMGRT